MYVEIKRPMFYPMLFYSSDTRPLKAILFDSIRDVPKADWDFVQKNHSYTFSYPFWELIEHAKLNDFSHRHILFYNDAQQPIGLASFYIVTTDLAIFAPVWLRNVLQKIREIFPNFLKVSMLECGTPITLNPPFVCQVAEKSESLLTDLYQLLLDIAKKERCFLMVLRDFEPETSALHSTLEKLGLVLVEGLPNTYLEIAWSTPEQYISSMKSYYRSKLLKHLRINEKQGIRYELQDDFAHLAETLCQQWQVVHQQADEYQREVLTPEFYRQFSQNLGEHSKALLFYRENELIGHALLLVDGDMLRWLYVGRKEAANDSLYIYVAHKVVETAILLGAKRLEMGLTTYSIKKDLGAQLIPIKLALRAPSWWIHPFVKWFYPLLNHVPAIENKTIFKV